MEKIFILFIFFVLFSCNQNNKAKPGAAQQDTVIVAKPLLTSLDKDSVALLQLTKALYHWNQADENDDYFSPLKKVKSDTIYAGLDLEWNKQKLKEIRRTGLFSEQFIANYNKIALAIDSKIKDKTLRWNVGELPPFGNDANPWCNCQDMPSDFLNKLWIMRLTIKDNHASYNLSWGNGIVYNIKAVKENNQWKISYMEGFDYDGFIQTFQQQNDFTGKWQNEMVTLNIGESSLAFEYHGQCVYFYPVKKINDTEFEMIWARDMDCKFDNGTNEKFGLKNTPELGKPFAKFSLKNNVLYAEYHYKEWVEKYTNQVQRGVFTPQYLRKNEQ